MSLDGVQDRSDRMRLIVDIDGLCHDAGEGLECLWVHHLADKHDGGLHITEGPPDVK